MAWATQDQTRKRRGFGAWRGGWREGSRVAKTAKRYGTKSEALTAARAAEQAYADRTRRGVTDEQAAWTVSDFAARVWADLRVSGALVPDTVDGYESTTRLWIDPLPIGRLRVSTITREDVKQWVRDLAAGRRADGKVCPAPTRRAALKVLSVVMTVAVEDGIAPGHPVLRPRKIVGENRKRKGVALTPEQFARLVAEVGAPHDVKTAAGGGRSGYVTLNATPQYRGLTFGLGFLGLRIGEAIELRCGDLEWADVAGNPCRPSDAASVVVTVSRNAKFRTGEGLVARDRTKSGEDRIRRLGVHTPEVVAELASHVEQFSDPDDPRALVFPSKALRAATPGEDCRVRPENYRRRVLLPALARAGLDPIRVHDLRHTAANIAAHAGNVAMSDVKELLGHGSEVVTGIYVHGEARGALDGAGAAWVAAHRVPATVTPITAARGRGRG